MARVAFIGLGVMGEPICRNLLRKSGRKVLAFDLAAEPLARIVAGGAVAAKSVADVVGGSDVALSLPAERKARAVGIRRRHLAGGQARPDHHRSRHVRGWDDA